MKVLDYVKHIIITSPILVYPDLVMQYCLFTDSSRHSCSGILIQYIEQVKEDGTELRD